MWCESKIFLGFINRQSLEQNKLEFGGKLVWNNSAQKHTCTEMDSPKNITPPLPSTGRLEGDRENAILSNSRRSNFLEVFHAPLFKELEDRRRL